MVGSTESIFPSAVPTDRDIAATLDRWRGRYAGADDGLPFAVRVEEHPNVNRRGMYGYDGQKHEFWFNRHWLADRRFAAIAAHEFGHFLNQLTNTHRVLRWSRRLRGRDEGAEFDRVDFRWLFFTGVFFLEEIRADRHAIRILRDHGKDPRLVCELHSEPMLNRRGLEVPADTMTRLVRYAHSKWRLAMG